MHILPLNLKFSDNSAKYTSNTYHTKLTFTGKKDEFVKKTIKNNTIKEAGKYVAATLISIFNFSKLHNISRGTVATAIENGELDAVGAKIVVDSPKTEEFLHKYEGKEEYALKVISATDFSKRYNISSSKIKQLIQDGTIDTKGKKIDLSSEKTKTFIQELERKSTEKTKATVQKSERKSTEKNDKKLNKVQMLKTHLAKLLGVNSHTINYHISKGHLEINEDSTIDITKPVNNAFIRNFNKLTRKKDVKYTPMTYDRLQNRLGKLPLEYCIQHNLIKVDEDENISFVSGANKEFIEKVDKKEITVDTYFLTTQRFAEKLGIAKKTVGRAIKNNEIELTSAKKIDINNPKNIAYANKIAEKKALENNPKLFNMSAFARLVGLEPYIIKSHIEAGDLVRDEKGYINMTIEKNIYFVNRIKNGTYEPRKKVVRRPRNYKKVEKTDGNFLNLSEFAKIINSTIVRVRERIKQGQINYIKGKGIDMTDPHNTYFLEQYEPGRRYVPKATAKVEKEVVLEDKKDFSKKVKFNSVNLREFANLILLTNTPTLVYVDKGLVVREEDGLINLDNPINKAFLKERGEKIKTTYSQMSDGELKIHIANLKNLILKRLSSYNFTNALEYIDDNKFLMGYLRYTLNKIVKMKELTETQQNQMVKLLEELIFDSIENEDDIVEQNIISDNKLDIASYRYLLDEMSARAIVYESDIKEKFVKPRVISDDNKKVKSFKEHLMASKKAFSQDIENLAKLESADINTLIDIYLYNKYKIAEATNNHVGLYLEMRNMNLIDTIDTKKSIIIVEKILTKDLDELSLDYAKFKEWKMMSHPYKIDEIIRKALRIYREDLISRIASDRSYKMYQDAYPEKVISKEDFVEFMKKEFNL